MLRNDENVRQATRVLENRASRNVGNLCIAIGHTYGWSGCFPGYEQALTDPLADNGG